MIMGGAQTIYATTITMANNCEVYVFSVSDYVHLQ